MQLRTTICLSVLAVASAAWLPAALAQNPTPPAPTAGSCPAGSRRPRAACHARQLSPVCTICSCGFSPGRPGKLYRNLSHQADGGRFSPRILGIRQQPRLADPGYPADARAGREPSLGSGQGGHPGPRSRWRSSLSLPCPMENSWSPIRSCPSVPSHFRPIARFCRRAPRAIQGRRLQSYGDCGVLRFRVPTLQGSTAHHRQAAGGLSQRSFRLPGFPAHPDSHRGVQGVDTRVLCRQSRRQRGLLQVFRCAL